MHRTDRNGGAWFAPKTHGYGAGLPIAWQGWVVLIAYLAIASLSAWVGTTVARTGPFIAAGMMIFATIALFAISARTTRGGWRWRWGGDS